MSTVNPKNKLGRVFGDYVRDEQMLLTLEHINFGYIFNTVHKRNNSSIASETKYTQFSLIKNYEIIF